MSTKVSIVIITKDTKELLGNLLKSIDEDNSLRSFIGKIIIVDNASADGTEKMVRDEFPAVVYLRNKKNMGFAFSVNKGSSLTEDKYVLFLNSDTVLIEGELEKMVRFMDSNADVAICGPQLVYPDMKPQRSYAAVPSLAREIFPLGKNGGQRFKVKGPGFKVKSSISSLRPSVSNPLPPTSSAFEVASLIGAAILVRREILKTVGGFDERFFFFLEETDLCVGVWQSGHRVVFYPDARIIHLQGKTVRKSWISGRMEYNISLRKFIKKHHRPAYYSVFLAVRFIKTLFLVIFLPLLFFGRRMRMKYAYYVRLISWYFRGCPDNAGLRHDTDA
jgi:GT2 family glycosyltransferase